MGKTRGKEEEGGVEEEEGSKDIGAGEVEAEKGRKGGSGGAM